MYVYNKVQVFMYFIIIIIIIIVTTVVLYSASYVCMYERVCMYCMYERTCTAPLK